MLDDQVKLLASSNLSVDDQTRTADLWATLLNATFLDCEGPTIRSDILEYLAEDLLQIDFITFYGKLYEGFESADGGSRTRRHSVSTPSVKHGFPAKRSTRLAAGTDPYSPPLRATKRWRR